MTGYVLEEFKSAGCQGNVALFCDPEELAGLNVVSVQVIEIGVVVVGIPSEVVLVVHLLDDLDDSGAVFLSS